MSPVSLLLPSILTTATGQTALVPLLCVIPPHCSASLPGPSPKHIPFQCLLPLNISFSPNVRWLSSTWQKKPHSFTPLAKFCRPFHHPIRILDWQKGPWFSNPAHNSTATHTIYWLLQINGCQTKPVAKSPGLLALCLQRTVSGNAYPQWIRPSPLTQLSAHSLNASLATWAGKEFAFPFHSTETCIQLGPGSCLVS